MPPWGAVAGFGHFSNDVSLTPREMDIILSWADGGAPSGVLKAEESIPPVFVSASAAVGRRRTGRSAQPRQRDDDCSRNGGSDTTL